MLLLHRQMGKKKGKRVKKIEVPTETHTEFELGDMAADIWRSKAAREGKVGRGTETEGRN